MLKDVAGQILAIIFILTSMLKYGKVEIYKKLELIVLEIIVVQLGFVIVEELRQTERHLKTLEQKVKKKVYYMYLKH